MPWLVWLSRLGPGLRMSSVRFPVRAQAWVRSPAGGLREASNRGLSRAWMFFSFSFSLPSPSLKINMYLKKRKQRKKILKGKEGIKESEKIKWREDPTPVPRLSRFLPRGAWPQDASPGHRGAQGLGPGLRVGLGAGDLGQGMGLVAGSWWWAAQGLGCYLEAGAQWPGAVRPSQRSAHSSQ